MSSELDEALGPDTARRIAEAPQTGQRAIAKDLAAAAADLAGLTLDEREQPGDAAERLDAEYFDLRDAEDPSWEAVFRRARAASALVAAHDGDVGRAAYEAKHTGLAPEALAALVDRHI